MLLEDEEWAPWSDREIARRCGVHWDTVGRIRTELSLSASDSEAADLERTYTTKHSTVATMQTGAIADATFF